MKSSILAASLLLAISGVASAGIITPVNVDPAGSGLNDPTARAPVGLNPGTSVGEQRRLVYQFAADIWGSVLQSDVEVRVGASFAPLSCMATSGVLGSAGATQIFRDFDGAPLEGTWYHSALADAIAGVELDETADLDISSRFNANLGTTGCLEGSAWYYGLDGKTPAGAINFLDVVLHEIGHGLGFQGFSDSTTGELFDDLPDVYGANVFDNVSNSKFNDLTNAGRQAAIIGGSVVWTGANVTAQVPQELAVQTKLTTGGTLPNGSFNYGTASFGPLASTTNFSGMVALATDGTATGSQACGPLTNAAAVAGKLALVDRGTCAFTVKALNAQNAGAIGLIVADNVTGSPPGLGGSDPAVTIPAVRVSMGAGTLIKNASPGVSVGITPVPGAYAGADSAGRALLFSPNPVQPGSSFSHYDTSAFPNALMEPAINGDLDGNFRLDLSPALYADEGWVLNAGNAKTRGGKCDTGVKVVREAGAIPGANIVAAESLCRTRNPSNSAGFRSCIAPFVSALQDADLISKGPNSRVAICLK